MESREINILEVLQNEDNLSQREIAERTGMSLGMVNMLLKKCIKKGFVKIERLNGRSVRYILTPKGFKEKTKKTLEYISKSYRAIIKITNYIKELTEQQVKDGKEIWILGNKDEMFELVTTVLKEMKIDFEITSKIENIDPKDNTVIYLWEPEIEEKIKELKVNYINVFTQT